jgi:hypothetical protein
MRVITMKNILRKKKLKTLAVGMLLLISFCLISLTVAAAGNGYIADKPLTTYRHDTITGDLCFSHGDSSPSGKLYNTDGSYAVNHQVTLPTGASVEFARLYNYWTWSASGTTGVYPTMELTFEGNTISPDEQYDDRKGSDPYNYPAGTWAYDVTSCITGSGDYTTTIVNSNSDPANYVCINGIGLLIVYSDSGGQQIEYWINEGADMLSTMDTSGGVTAEEATTISKFSGSVDLSSVDNARLWTVVQAGGDEDNKLIFNAADWTGVYDSTPYSDLDIDEARDVTSHLVASDNIAKIQAAPPNPGDYLMPSNAFLVIAKSDDGDGDWREEWMGENSDGGTAVTTSELQTAIHHWLDDIPVRDHVLSTEDLQEVIVVWLSE